VYGNNYPRTRSPSPLRSGFKVDPQTGEIQSEDGSDDDDNDDEENDATWGRRSHSPNPSISKFASSFAQRVGSFVSSVGSAVPPSMPTDEELERDAERDRERSRREAERILTREAEERRIMEEKVFGMLSTTHDSPKHVSPARSQSMPSFDTPSPTPSQRENGITSWWSAAKNRLTPTKEPLTAAQQVIQEAKEKEKRDKKESKKDKDKRRSGEWPSTPENKYSNPALLSLASPSRPLQCTRQLRRHLHQPPEVRTFHQASLPAWHQALYEPAKIVETRRLVLRLGTRLRSTHSSMNKAR
jgi:hypothetical protein